MQYLVMVLATIVTQKIESNLTDLRPKGIGTEGRV